MPLSAPGAPFKFRIIHQAKRRSRERGRAASQGRGRGRGRVRDEGGGWRQHNLNAVFVRLRVFPPSPFGLRRGKGVFVLNPGPPAAVQGPRRIRTEDQRRDAKTQYVCFLRLPVSASLR